MVGDNIAGSVLGYQDPKENSQKIYEQFVPVFLYFCKKKNKFRPNKLVRKQIEI